MITGSSAITNQEKVNIQTPKIRMNLKENQEMSIAPCFASLDVLWNSIYYKNRIIINGSSVNSNTLDTYTSDGLSLIQSLLVPSLGSFYLNGSTLSFFVAGDSSSIWRLDTNDGTNWGNSTITAGISTNGKFAVASLNKIYITPNYGNTNVGGGQNQFEYDIKCAIYNGTTWILNDTFTTHYWQRSVETGMIFVKQVYPEKDILIVPLSFTPYESRYGTNFYRIVTDGTNIFSTDYIYQKAGSETQVHPGMMSYGPSKMTLPFFFSDPTYQLIPGGTLRYYQDYNMAVLQSTNFETWEGPIFVGQSRFSTGVIGSASKGSLYTCISGVSCPYDYIILGASTNAVSPSRQEYAIFVNSNLNTTDISNNIINYYNQNNERINLTLGNLK